MFSFNTATGYLAEAQRLPVPGIAMPMALSPDNRTLHVALRSEPWAIASFRIDGAAGRLRPLGVTPAAANFAYIATDRGGRYLLGASFTGSCLAVAAIDNDGAVAAQATQIVDTPAAAHCILADLKNRQLFVPCRDGNCVLRLPFDPASGRVDEAAARRIVMHDGAGPRHIAFHPSGAVLYLLNESDGSLVILPVDDMPGAPVPSAIPTPIQMCDACPPGFSGPAAAADIHLTPDSRFLYASVRGSNTLAGFAVSQDGTGLSPIGHWRTETHPRGFAVSPDGCWLVAAGLHSHRLAVYGIDPASGVLDHRHTITSPGGPNWVTFVQPR